jgi:hypothetical protein
MGSVGPLLLLFSLAGGYAFLQVCHFTKYRWDALEWERNVFEAAVVGGGLFVAVRLAIPPLERFPEFLAVRNTIRAALPYPFAPSFAAALALAFVLAGLVNKAYPRQRAIRRAVRLHGGELLIVLQHAGRHKLPVSLTMKNRKVYVGYVLAPPSLRYPYAKVIPTVTGYRDEATMNVTLDTPYWHVYADLERRKGTGEVIGLDMESFGIVLPIPQVCSANLFDEEVYARYFNTTATDDGASVAPTGPPDPAVR